MDPQSGLCVGCQRTLDEIAAWGSASAERKTLILQEVERRRQEAAHRQGES